MRNFHGTNHRSRFFEGWYLKHQKDGRTIAFIPSYHLDQEGNPSASMQVITNEGSHSVSFPASEFYAAPRRFYVKIGKNVFSDLGMRISLQGEKISVSGLLHYTPFRRPASDMMGPFRHIPQMECNHGVLSLSHRLFGTLTVNGTEYDFSDGIGYIEKDWGNSFPSSYLWTQCGWPDASKDTVMISVADIPMLGRRFTGCISSVLLSGREYRLATYRGATVKKCTEREVILEQGNKRLQARLIDGNPHPLQAPCQGAMRRIVRESPCCTVHYRMWIGSDKVFDRIGTCAGFETSSLGTQRSGMAVTLPTS